MLTCELVSCNTAFNCGAVKELIIWFYVANKDDKKYQINLLLCRNLQAAVCSYFEYDQPTVRSPQMSFVKDITIGEGESVTPNTKFTKTWRIQNTG
jgi:hypothetical protein